MSMMGLVELRGRLMTEYDVKGWWPSETPFEVMVGAILTQQTTWETVARVLDVLRNEGLLEVRELAHCERERLERLIRPSGFYRQKAVRLLHLVEHVVSEYDGDVSTMLDQDLDVLRAELLSLPGIGPETADSIILFAAGKPKFVAAAYVSRVLSRTGVLPEVGYHQVQDFVERTIRPDAASYRELYALLVKHARTVCRREPRCSACTLANLCRLALTSKRTRCCPRPQR
jgi:endonuclease-3 related protein